MLFVQLRGLRLRIACDTNTCSYGSTMHYEVDVVVRQPLDDNARRFLSDVQRSAHRVLRFRGDDGTITITVEVTPWIGMRHPGG